MSEEMLQVAVTVDGPQATVVVNGEIDLHSASILVAGVDEALAGGACSLAFEVAGVSFMDSTGLGILATASDRANAAGGTVKVNGASPTLRRLFMVSGLDTVIEVS